MKPTPKLAPYVCINSPSASRILTMVQLSIHVDFVTSVEGLPLLMPTSKAENRAQGSNGAAACLT